MNLIFKYLACALLILFAEAAYSQPPKTALTVEEAKKVALVALQSAGPYISFDYYRPMQNSPGFYVLEAVNTNKNSPYHFDTVAINIVTGDIWDLQGILNKNGDCQLIKSPELAEIQRTIRSKAKITDRDYLQYHVKTPNCLTMSKPSAVSSLGKGRDKDRSTSSVNRDDKEL